MLSKETKIVLLLFFMLILIRSILIWLINKLITDEMIYEELIGIFEQQDIVEILLKRSQQINYASYVLDMFEIVFKVLSVYSFIVIGLFIVKIEIKSLEIFKALIISEFIFVLPMFIKLVWFTFFELDYKLKNIGGFVGFSVLDFFTLDANYIWAKYPLRQLNLFEGIYWTLLAFQLKRITGRSFPKNLGFVASTYGVGLSIWVLFVMFILLSIS